MSLICDAGPILGALDRDDAAHQKCTALFASPTQDLIIPGLVLAEVDYWCAKRRIQPLWLAFLEDVDAGAWLIDWPTAVDMERALEIQKKYPEVGVVDATVLACVERHGETKLATLDHRHFAMLKPAHVEALTLLPTG